MSSNKEYSLRMIRKPLSKEYREELIEAYVYRVVEDMDLKTLCSVASDCITDNLKDYTDEQLINEITEYYPDLL